MSPCPSKGLPREAAAEVSSAMDTDGPRACDDMTVEVALSVMASARTGHLLVCDGDGLYAGLLTRAQLVEVRDGLGYTDRIRLRDVLEGPGPSTSPATAVAEARHLMRDHQLHVLPVVDEHGSALGVLALAR
ncbi:CBS domain-containing protein [Streptomyces sp. NPDC005438]|uniref:CBS domain-containing protein n=1 Tax=Streptomyces sp. NPDC005438 TaxID=3156880 RepID=UPI0033A9C58E